MNEQELTPAHRAEKAASDVWQAVVAAEDHVGNLTAYDRVVLRDARARIDLIVTRSLAKEAA